MKVEKTSIPGVLVFTPDVFKDDRGYFMESYHAKKYSELGLDIDFVQDNESRSTKGVLRGLHYQLKTPQGKLVRVIQGEVIDYAVDIRKGSPTFCKYESVVLSGDNKKQFYVPPGFAHGFYTLSETAIMAYKCTDYYHGEDDKGIIWNDPEIAIDWPETNPALSPKDLIHPLLKDADLPVYK